LAGCQQTTTTVEGNVTFRGEPVKNGSISFRPVDGGSPGFGAMIEDGHYIATDAIPGTMIATISGGEQGEVIQSRQQAMQRSAEERARDRQAMEAARQNSVRPGTPGNGKKVEIVLGRQTKDFDLDPPAQ
jgi:hypothetical protein